MKTIAEQLNVKDFPFLIKDKQGNEIYYEIDGYWSKKEYDSKNRETYCEDSSGFSWKREFDSDGNIIYFQNSRGEIQDNRPKEDWLNVSYWGGLKNKDEIITLNGIKYKRIEQ